MGRDLLSRTMMGGREAITVTLLVLCWPWLGWSGRYDTGLCRWSCGCLGDALYRCAVGHPLAVVPAAGDRIDGAQTWTLVLTLGFFFGIAVVRVVRGATLEYVPRDLYWQRTRGRSRLTIVVRELLPNVLDALLVEAAMHRAWMLLAFSSLSFLGFGVVPPTPD